MLMRPLWWAVAVAFALLAIVWVVQTEKSLLAPVGAWLAAWLVAGAGVDIWQKSGRGGLGDKLRRALLELDEQATVAIDNEQLGVLKSAWIDGFEALADSDYDTLRTMARRVNMPPYQEF